VAALGAAGFVCAAFGARRMIRAAGTVACRHGLGARTGLAGRAAARCHQDSGGKDRHKHHHCFHSNFPLVIRGLAFYQ